MRTNAPARIQRSNFRFVIPVIRTGDDVEARFVGTSYVVPELVSLYNLSGYVDSIQAKTTLVLLWRRESE